MSDLYTSIMEKVMPILQEYWQFSIIAFGALFLLGSIFRWKWVCDPQGENTMGFRAFVYRTFGEKGYRIINGFSGAIIIVCGIVMWVLMNYSH